MIPKEIHDLRLEKLRLILLMDSRFNHNNKIIGKRTMEFGEKHNLLVGEQYGSRKSKSAIDHALNKRLVLDIIRQTKTSYVKPRHLQYIVQMMQNHAMTGYYLWWHI